MPRFFFHLRNRNEIAREVEGIDLLDAKAARLFAMKTALDILEDAARHRANPPEFFLIDDDSGQEVMRLPFKDMLLGEHAQSPN